MSTINISLSRDPRFPAAQARLTELQVEFNALEAQRAATHSRAASAPRVRDLVKEEAAALISGGAPPDAGFSREQDLRTLAELDHRILVLREALSQQRTIIEALRCEVSRAISQEMKPAHVANVRAVYDALLNLDAALQAEHALRDTLFAEGVLYQSNIRPMNLPKLGMLSDSNSRASSWALDALDHGYVELKELPASLQEAGRAKLGAKAPKAPSFAPRKKLDPADWTAA